MSLGAPFALPPVGDGWFAGSRAALMLMSARQVLGTTIPEESGRRSPLSSRRGHGLTLTTRIRTDEILMQDGGDIYSGDQIFLLEP